MLSIEWKKIWKNKFMVVVLIAIMLIPSIYAVGFLKSMWDPYGKIKNLPVAVVNEDQSVVYHDKKLAVGDQLQKKLEKSDAMKFSFPTKKVAVSGLSSGKYYMVMTIPEDFSKNATTLMDKQPKKMVLKYSTSAGHSFIAEKFSKSGAESIASAISTTITKNYAETMFSQIQTMGNGFSNAANGNKKLARGSEQLKVGSDKLNTNLQLLSTSTLTFSNGSHTLTQGLDQYFNGVSQVASGSTKISSGLNQLSGNVSKLNNGMGQLYTGSAQLDSGIGQYTAGVDRVNQGASALNQGAQQLAASSGTVGSGVKALSDGAAALHHGVVQYTNGTTTAYKASEQISSGLAQMNTALNSQDSKEKMQQLQAGLQAYQAGLAHLKTSLNGNDNQNSDVVNQMTTSMTNLADNLTTMSQYISETQTKLTTVAQAQHLTSEQIHALESAMLPSDAVNASLKSATHNLQTLQSQLPALLQTNNVTLKQAQTSVDSLANSFGNGTEGTKTVYGGINSLIASMTAVQGNAAQLTNGANQLTGGLSQSDQQSNKLLTGATQLNNGLGQLNANIPALTNGINALATGSSKLNTGTQALSGSNKNLNTGAQKLTNGLSDVNKNMPVLDHAVSQLATGSNQATHGLSQLTNNNSKLLAGSQKLSQGAVKISDGTHKLADGSGQLGDGISKVTDGNSLLASKLAQVGEKASDVKPSQTTYRQLATPTTTKHTEKDNVPNNGTAMAPYMLSVALFVGAVAFNFMFDLVTPLKYPKKAISWWASKMSVLYPFAFLQAAVMYVVALTIVGIKPVNYGATFVVIVVTSFAFIAVVTALNLWFGKVGSFLAMILMIVQLGGSAGTYPIQLSNGFFEAIHPYLPMTYSVNALRESLMIGNSAMPDILVLLLIFVLFTLIMIGFYMTKKRHLKKINYRKA